MGWTFTAACGCHRGNYRANNEDNFFFEGKCLEQIHDTLPNPVAWEGAVKTGLCMAVFDGVGGANFGEVASFVAARTLQQTQRSMADFFVAERNYLRRLTSQMNLAVVEAARERNTALMGSTMVALYFSGRSVYLCNVGDSRGYRLRDGVLSQISKDHTQPIPGKPGKNGITQYLGMDPEEIAIDPYIAKGELRHDDVYLICSDGVTDMLSNFEIADILLGQEDPEEAVRQIVDGALARGGRDNITVIVCRIKQA
jgi:protein phosphatase